MMDLFAKMTKRILLICFHFPPCDQSTGYHRSLSMVKYLPEFGWETSVLTARPICYESVNYESEKYIPANQAVKRTFCLDLKRHLSIRGRYPGFLEKPDRWASWLFTAIPSALSQIKKIKPDLIWSTQPIPSSHLIAYLVHKITGVKWVADFRDPIIGPDNYISQRSKAMKRWLEKKVITHASAIVCTTESMCSLYKNRYPEVDPGLFRIIENGYDEDTFREVDASKGPDVIRIVHSGHLYDEGRSPIPFFHAIARLKEKNKIDGRKIQVILRASGSESLYSKVIDDLNIGDIVRLENKISYKEAIQEVSSSDGLLLFQGKEFNAQIPAKVYEYIRANKPIFCLTDSKGDTYKLVSSLSTGFLADIESEEDIEQKFAEFIRRIEEGRIDSLHDDVIKGYSRKAKVEEYSRLLDRIT